MGKPRTLLLLLAGCWSWTFAATPESKTDTLVVLEEITVVAPRANHYLDDLKVIRLDSAERTDRSLLTLEELLNTYTSLNTIAYGGRGSLVTMSLRGNTTAGTRILWQGFPVNSPTSGVADISGIRPALFGAIEIIPEAPASLYGSGSAGGIVMLRGTGSERMGWHPSIAFTTGSFGLFSTSAKMSYRGENTKYSLQFTGESVKNDFSYRDIYKPGQPVEKNEHAGYKMTGVLQDLSIKLNRYNHLTAGLWLQRSSREIPPAMGSYASPLQHQNDSLLRMFVGWESRKPRRIIQWRTAWFGDGLRFTEESAPPGTGYTIDSHIRSGSTMSDASIMWYPAKGLSFDFGGSVTLLHAFADNYSTPVQEVRPVIYSGMKLRKPDWTLNFSLRQGFLDEHSAPQFSAGIRLKIKETGWWVRGRFFTHYRLPALNDKYWSPGGNPDLQPEKGWGMTAGTEGKFDWNRFVTLTLISDFYYQNLQDQIYWVPANGFWTPGNIQQSRILGLEQSLALNISAGNHSLRLKTHYRFTRSIIAGNDLFSGYTGKLNPYIPVHSWTTTAGAQFGKTTVSIYHRFCSSRYTTRDNAQWYALPAFSVISFSAGYTAVISKIKWTLGCFVSNLLNQQYQYISGHPVPGRSFNLTLKIDFNNL